MKTKFFKRVVWLMIPLFTIFTTNVWGAETSFTFTPTSTSAGSTSGTVPDGVTCSYSNTYTNKNQCTKNNSISFSTSGMSSLSITKIVVSLSKSKDGKGTSTIKIGTSTIGTRTSYDKNTSSGTEYTFNNTEEATGEVSVSVSATGSSLYFWYVKVYYDPDAGGTPTCATPTFSPAAGSYIGTQSVTISSTTTGSTIYYTTDGSTPTTGSAHGTAGEASATVSVSSNMTLKAIAVKDGANNSTVGTATYSIVSCSGDEFSWNLATNSYDASPTDELIKWTGTYATMQNSQGSGTKVTNYIPTSYSSTRFYNGNTLTITPASGVTISHVVFTATTDGYAGVLRNSSTWSNATASGSGTYVIVTPTDGTTAFSAAVGGTCGFTNVYVCYTAAACDDDPTIGTAQLNGTFNSSNIYVTCPSISAGSNCSINDYGFVWKAGSVPTISDNKTQVGTNNQSIAFEGTLSGTFNTSTTYYVKAYATNNGDNTTLSSTALVINPRSITFNSNGGSSVAQIFVNSGSVATQPTDPTKDGYGFEGWFTDNGTFASPVNWSATITSNQNYYAKWGALKYDVTYNAGANGTGSVEGQKKTHDVALTLSSETFTREGYTQDGWSTTDGGDKAYELGGSYTANAAITLYPHWAINNYTVSWSVNGSTWSSGVTDANNNANYGSTVSAPTAPTSSDCDDSKVFVGWTATPDYSDADNAPADLFTTTSPAITSDATFYAVFAEASGTPSNEYQLVTNISQLSAGDKIVIAGAKTTSTYLLGYQRHTDAGYHFRPQSSNAYTITSSKVTLTSSDIAAIASDETHPYVLTLGKNGDYWTFYDAVNGGYLCATTADKNELNVRAEDSDGASRFTISISSDAASITSQVTPESTPHNLLQYLTNTFSCYKSTSGGTNPYIFRNLSSVSYSDYTTSCCQQPTTQLAIAADKTELIKSGIVNFTLSGGNGQDITWSCRDEADENCDALLSSTSNSGATLTISTPVSATKIYTVSAVQPEDDDDAEVVCGKTVTMDITVKAQWTITFKTTDDGLLSTYSTETVTDGESYTFPDLSDEYTCETNYSFVGWRATNTAGAPEYAGGSSATASENKTWYAVWMYSTGTTTETRDKYELVTSSSTAIAEDDVVVIACNTQGVALAQMSTSDTYGSPVAVDFATDKSYLTFASGTNVMELKVLYYDSEGSWYFEDNATSSYFINYTENATLTYKYNSFWTWTITPDASGNANIVDYEASSYKLQYRKETSRFAFYTGSNKAVQLYRKNGTVSVEVPATPTYYVNNTHCTNGATIRANDGQWVTSAKDQKVRITIPVTAKNFETSGKQLTASSENSHFSVSFPSHTIPSDKSEVVVNMVVEYTPIEANTIEEASITITTGTGDGNATKVISVNGRSLPDEFVIVTQKEGKWQALPADMFSGTGTYSPIEVTPNGGITAIPAAPYTTIYSAREVASGRYETAGTCVRLVGNNNKCLWANNSSNGTGIQNFAALGNTNDSKYEWLLSTADGEQYTIANPAHPDYATGRQLGIYTLKYGLYKTTDIFYLLPVGCSSQPGNLQITPRRVDAMFSWETNVASVTIDLWTNEAMSEGHKQAVVTSVPYQFTGLAESKEYWYKITPGSDDDCALTGSFSTTGPTIELVEWGENSATIFVDKDEAVDPQIIIAGEVEHGQSGTAATDIFFSKYFEAQEKAKMLAIYNGTGNAISLADITIVQRANAPALSLAKYGKTPGYIQPGEEIILYYPSSVSDIMECAKKEKSFNTWNDVSSETGSNNLDFGGKGTIRMFRGSKCIDIIGAMASDATAADMNNATVRPIDGPTKPSFGDDQGFVTNAGDNYETDEEESNYELSTNRCLLIRKPHVVSGDSAVLNNFGDFKTLGTYTGVDSKTHKGEWAGLQIPNGPTGDKYHYTCEGFKDVGVFDYNKYYREYTQIGEDKYLSNFTRAEDGTYTLSIDNMRQYACLNLKFQLTEHDNKANVLTEQTVQVPIVVKDARTSDDELFNTIIKSDEPPYNPMIPESIERCKTCNVVVLSTGTLTKAADGTTNDVAELRDVKVYPGGKLIVPEGTHYVINSLSLRRQEDVVAAAKINSGLADDPDDITDKGIYIRESNGVYLDVRIDPSKWHYFTLPYDCRVGDIRFSDGTPAKVNNDYLLGWYDGAYRAEHKEGGWTDITDDDYVLKKGLGYIVALPGSGLIKRELRFPMANNVIAEELGDKTVGGLYAYGGDKTDEELRPNHKGWNMIGNPYLYDYTTNIVTDPLAVGELEHDPSGSSWNGKWVRTGSARYIVAPIDDNGWKGYEQTTISNLRPFMSYFIQVGTKTDGTENPETERSITFDKDQKPASIIRRAQAEDAEPMYPVWYGLELLAPNGEKDNTTLLISNEFTDDYDMMDDLIKMRGSYYNYYQNPVLASRNNSGEMAFNALPDSSAAVIGVPLNYYAYQAGTYTFATDSRYDLEEVKSAMLFDATTQQYYDLLTENHSFSLAKGDNNARFKLYVRVERKKAPEIATGTDNILTDGKLSLIAIDKTLVLSGLTDAADVYVYDMSGKMIKSEHGAGNGIWRATVPATGVYFVRVNSATGQQTLRAIVK